MENLNEVVEIFDLITKTSGKNDKIKIVKKNKDNELFIECLKFLLDSNIVTGLSKKKINKNVPLDNELFIECLKLLFDSDITTELSEKKINKNVPLGNDKLKLDTIREVMEYLKAHNSGRDVDIAIVREFCNKQTDTNKEFCIGLFTKSLKIGIDVKGVNKAIPNLIPSFDIMLGSKGDLNKLPKGNKFITEKYDGVRCFTQIRNGKIIMKSRQNKIFEGLVDIENSIIELGLDNICLDGELLSIESPYETVYKDTMKIVSTKDKEKHGIKYQIFDIVPLVEFDNKKGEMKYSERRSLLNTIKDTKYINITPILYEGTDDKEVLRILSGLRNKGAEGAMINIDRPYDFKRSKVLLKLKVMSTCDLKVIGFEEGDGKFKGTLGKIICDYKGYDLGVGSGFSDDMRDEIWNNKDKYLNKIIEIQYFEETNNEKGELSLRFPVFKRCRFEKDEVSYE